MAKVIKRKTKVIKRKTPNVHQGEIIRISAKCALVATMLLQTLEAKEMLQPLTWGNEMPPQDEGSKCKFVYMMEDGKVTNSKLFEQIEEFIPRCAKLLQTCCKNKVPELPTDVFAHCYVAGATSGMGAHLDESQVKHGAVSLVVTPGDKPGTCFYTCDVDSPEERRDHPLEPGHAVAFRNDVWHGVHACTRDQPRISVSFFF